MMQGHGKSLKHLELDRVSLDFSDGSQCHTHGQAAENRHGALGINSDEPGGLVLGVEPSV